MSQQYYVYIVSNKINTVVYIGMTRDLSKRVGQHKEREIAGFSAQYNVTKLVYYEIHQSVHLALLREKQIKKWKRAWKDNLIRGLNPGWRDLSDNIF